MTPDPIKKRIAELVPEIMELKFGCRVIPKYLDALTYTIIKKFPVTPDGSQVYKMDDGSQIIKSDLKEILGRPIQLADVLRAIPNKSIGINGLGVFIEDYEDEPTRDTGGYWDLKKDYDDQPQPVKDFIGRLLNVTT